MRLRPAVPALVALALATLVGCDPILPLHGTVYPAPASVAPSDTSVAFFAPTLDSAAASGLPGARIVLFSHAADAAANDSMRRKGRIIYATADSSGRFQTYFRYALFGSHRYYLWVGAPGYRAAIREVTADSLGSGFLRVMLVPVGTP